LDAWQVFPCPSPATAGARSRAWSPSLLPFSHVAACPYSTLPVVPLRPPPRRPQGELACVDGVVAAQVYDVLPWHMNVHPLRAARWHIDRLGFSDRFPVDQRIGNDTVQVRAAVVVEHDRDRHLTLLSCEAAHVHRQARLRRFAALSPLFPAGDKAHAESLTAATPAAAHDVGHQEDDGDDRRHDSDDGDCGSAHNHAAILALSPGWRTPGLSVWAHDLDALADWIEQTRP
jgi:hypothetical protein